MSDVDGYAFIARDQLRQAWCVDLRLRFIQAMILAGGRGKGTFSNGFQGGVHVIPSDPKEVERIAGQMLGNNLITKQTPPDGVTVHKVMVAESLDIDHETYVAQSITSATHAHILTDSLRHTI